MTIYLFRKGRIKHGESILRTEEIPDDQILTYYVGTKHDEKILEQLETAVPCLLEGSRGVGKSFLFKVLKQRLLGSYEKKRIIPVMVTFRNSSLLRAEDEVQFQYWMLTRISTEIIRALKKAGAIIAQHSFLHNYGLDEETALESICKQYENSWRFSNNIDASKLPTIDDLLQSVEDLCVDNNISRIIVNIDEAAHVFIPAQQRQFFTLFRDLRSPYLKCNAAIYPGTTCFGDSFQSMHDAISLHISRDVQDSDYISSMKEMVTKQLTNSDSFRLLSQHGDHFSLLAYAASGNPRLLFTSLGIIDKLNADNTNRIFREFYRERIWSEHSSLANKFPSCRKLIDWGRDFIETIVLQELKTKNDKYISEGKPTSICFWVHRDSPQIIKEALRLLEYTGIITENASGIRATRNAIGTRYLVNVGCLFALETNPTLTGLKIASKTTIKRMSEYGENSKYYEALEQERITLTEEDVNQFLTDQLEKSIDCLELTDWQKEKLHSVSIDTIGQLISASEEEIMRAYYAGNTRTRQMKNAAYAAVFEYLLG